MEKKIITLFIVVIVVVGLVFFWQLISPPKETPQKEFAQKDPSLENVMKRGKLIVAGDVPYGVMQFYDGSGSIVGIDVEISRQIASRLGVELEYRAYDWDYLFEAIKSGEIDFAASAITITPEREEEMRFSSPYFNGGQSVITLANDNRIKTSSDLADKKVGVQNETTGHYAVKKYVSDEFIITYNVFDDANYDSGILHDLITGKIDAVVVDYIAALSTIKGSSKFRLAVEPFTQEFYGFASKKGNDTLMDEVDKILRELKREDKLKEAQEKWTK